VALEYRRLGDTAACHRVLEESRHAAKPVGAPRVGPLAQVLDPLTGPTPVQLTERWIFPNRLVEYQALLTWVRALPSCAPLHALLGTWLYAHDRPREAITAWQHATSLDPSDWISQRNLGLAIMNHTPDADAAWGHYRRALALRPDHPRLRYETDQLAARRGVPLAERLELLAPDGRPVDRDDALITYIQLLLSTDDLEAARDLLASHTFQPWEGGEGQTLAAWDRCHLLATRRLLDAGRPERAVHMAEEAFDVPRSLGEQRHPLANTAALHLALGDALAAAERPVEATEQWGRAADQSGDFVQMSAEPFSEQTHYSIVALHRLGDHARAAALTDKLEAYLQTWTASPARVDFFATSLPSLLLFPADVRLVRERRARLMEAQLIHARDNKDQRALEVLNGLLAKAPDYTLALDLRNEFGRGH